MVLATSDDVLALSNTEVSTATSRWEASATSVAVHAPAKHLVIAGAVGGPAVIFGLTPMRNAITLAAKDQRSGALALYRRVMRTGGWTGGLAPSVPASPQFVMLGPLYHFWAGCLGCNAAAVAIVAMKETMLTYGSHTQNAQMAVNKTLPADRQIRVSSQFRLLGPGVSFHVMRNALGMSGLRLASEPAQEGVRQLHAALGCAPPTSRLVGDFMACFAAGAASMVPNQMYNFAVTTPEYAAGTARDRAALIKTFLQRQYFVQTPTGGCRLSPLVLRDLALRCNYNAAIWVIFGSMERSAANLFI